MIKGMVNDAVKKGADLLRGGNYKGTYFEPIVLDNVPVYAEIAHEEDLRPCGHQSSGPRMRTRP
jgi:acyl-CoA reductase-like NAD-dependent aldehyde dehydrogenase